jgi:hypothetical protein
MDFLINTILTRTLMLRQDLVVIGQDVDLLGEGHLWDVFPNKLM